MTKGNGKPCKKCGTSAWYNDGGCKECAKIRRRKWVEENRDYFNEYMREFRKNNPDYAERQKAASEKWRKEKRDPEYRRNHYWANRGKSLQASREWYEKNKEYQKRKARKWYRKNRRRANRASVEWARNNPQKKAEYDNRRRALKLQADGDYTAGEFERLCQQYKNRCLCCGKKTKMTADHVIPLTRGGSNDIGNIQPLCISCNASKGTKTTDYRTRPIMKRWMQPNLIEDENK